MKFNDLYEINVNEKTEQKGGLTYLSWAWAWAEVKKRCPDATYKILRDENGLPYFKEQDVGYMCMTEVTIDGETLMMWLPVMDYKNRAMMNPTMFDINKTIMRCLTKNLGMFGLGLYIYAGEDLPESDEDTSTSSKSSTTGKKSSKSSKDTSNEKKANLDDFTFEEKMGGLKKLFAMMGEAQQEFLDWLLGEYGYSNLDDIKENEIDAIGKVAKNLKITNDKRKENASE